MLKTFDYALETKAVGDAGEFEGYASTFGNIDQGGDKVEPGAFIESIVRAKNDGRIIPMLWQHDMHEPIGVWKDIAEDSKGLFVKGQLILEGDMTAQRAYGKLKARAIGGMSIGYSIPSGGAEVDDRNRGVTKLKKINLREISLVTAPMNISAKVTSIKSMMENGQVPTIREFEDFLRDVGGFSKSMAVAIASHGYANAIRRDSEGDKANDVAAFLQALRA
jgi:HK97 family phage prohead protease